jgi:hypothetical protein
MQISLIEGYHITARDRQAIAFAVEKGWSACNTKRKWYEIEREDANGDELYRVKFGNKCEARTSRVLVKIRRTERA